MGTPFNEQHGLQEPISFVNDIPDDRETAVIDLATLQRLAHNLVGADMKEIVNRFIQKIRPSTSLKSIEEYIKLLDDESAFHKTVNTITEYENYRKEQEELCEAMHKDGKT